MPASSALLPLEVEMQGATAGGGFVLAARLVRPAGLKAVQASLAPPTSLAQAVARVRQQVRCVARDAGGQRW